MEGVTGSIPVAPTTHSHKLNVSRHARDDLRHFKDLRDDFPHIPVSTGGIRLLLGAFGAPVSGPKNPDPGGIADEIMFKRAQKSVWILQMHSAFIISAASTCGLRALHARNLSQRFSNQTTSTVQSKISRRQRPT